MKKLPLFFLLFFSCQNQSSHTTCRATFRGVEVEIEVSELMQTKTIGSKTDEYFYYLFTLGIAGRPKLFAAAESQTFASRQNLSKVCKSLEIIFSQDKKHFVVAVNGKIEALYHLLPTGSPFASDFYRKYSLGFNDPNDLEWQILPDPDKIVTSILHNNRRFRELNAVGMEQMAVSLFQQPLAGSLDSALIQVYPQSLLAVEAMKLGKAEQLYKLNDSFFMPKIKAQINDPMAFDVNHKIALSINDTMFFESLDSFAQNTWLVLDSTTDYLSKRLTHPIALRESVLQDLKLKSIQYLKKSKQGYLPFLQQALHCLDKRCNQSEFETILQEAFGFLQYNSDQISSALISDFSSLSHQKVILDALIKNWDQFGPIFKRNAAKLMAANLSHSRLDSVKNSLVEFDKYLQ